MMFVSGISVVVGLYRQVRLLDMRWGGLEWLDQVDKEKKRQEEEREAEAEWICLEGA